MLIQYSKWMLRNAQILAAFIQWPSPIDLYCIVLTVYMNSSLKFIISMTVFTHKMLPVPIPHTITSTHSPSLLSSSPLPHRTECRTHAHPHTLRHTHLHADRQAISLRGAKCPVLGKPSGLHASGILVREQENMLLFQRLLACLSSFPR